MIEPFVFESYKWYSPRMLWDLVVHAFMRQWYHLFPKVMSEEENLRWVIRALRLQIAGAPYWVHGVEIGEFDEQDD